MNNLQKLLRDIANSAHPDMDDVTVVLSCFEDEDDLQWDVNDVSTHGEIWEETSATELSHLNFYNDQKHLIGRLAVLPYEGEDMFADWAVGLNATLEYLMDRITD